MQQLTADQISEIQEALRSEIRQKQELLRAYDLVRQHLGVNGQTQDAENGTLITARRRTRDSGVTFSKSYGENTRIVTDAIKQMPGAFTIRDIYKTLEGTGLSIEAVTTVFNTLRAKRVIEVVQKGKGRRATIFRNT